MASASRPKTVLSQLLLLLVLLLVLTALAAAYYFLTRPAAFQGDGDGRGEGFVRSLYGFEGDLLRRPTGVGIDPQGDIHVADTGKKRIVVFDSAGDFVTVYGTAGTGAFELDNPIDVAISSDGRSFVVDRTLGKVVVFDATRQPINEIAFEEPPTSVTIGGDEELLFITTDSGVLIGNLDGELLTGYIARGREPGQFDRPAGVAVGQDGTLYVCDSLNYRIQAISTSGQPLWQYGSPLPEGEALMYQGDDRKFGLPSSITIDENDRLYVVDGLDSEIDVLTTDGEFIETIGDVGHDDGLFYYPDGIDYHDGQIVVADKYNDRAQVFAVPLPPDEAWRAYIPYGVALLLLPLLLLLFLRRGRRYVATPGFVAVMGADEKDGSRIAATIRRIEGTAELIALTQGMEQLEPVDWRERHPATERARDLVDRFHLEEDRAALLAIAYQLKGKRLLLAEEPEVIAAAKELEVPTMTYEEIKAALDDQSGQDDQGGADAS